MADTLYASFPDVALAEKATGALLDYGVRAEDISLLGSDDNMPGAGATYNAGRGSDWQTAGSNNPGDRAASAAGMAGHGMAQAGDRTAATISDAFGAHDTAANYDAAAEQHAAAADVDRTTTRPNAPVRVPVTSDSPMVGTGPSAMSANSGRAASPPVPGVTDFNMDPANARDLYSGNAETRTSQDARADYAGAYTSPAATATADAYGATAAQDDDMVRDHTSRTDLDADRADNADLSAKSGISTTTGADAASGAAKGAGWGLAIGILAGIASLAIPGVGWVVGGGALATAIGGALGTAAAGAIAGGVTGYLKDQGVPSHVAETYNTTISQGGAVLAVHCPSNDVDCATMQSILGKYGAENVNTFGMSKQSMA